MENYPQELAQDAVYQSHTGHMTGLWFLSTRPLRLNTNEWMNHVLPRMRFGVCLRHLQEILDCFCTINPKVISMCCKKTVKNFLKMAQTTPKRAWGKKWSAYKKCALFFDKQKLTCQCWGLFDRASSSWNNLKCQLDATRCMYSNKITLLHQVGISDYVMLILTLILLTWRIWWAPNNASKWQMGFNSAFKGLKR